MFRFLFVATFAGLALSMGLRFPDTDLLSARYFDFKELCKWFCSDDHDYDYWFRTADEMIQPRIFCGLCDKKFNTTTTRPTTSTTPTTPTTPTKPTTPTTPTKPPTPTTPTTKNSTSITITTSTPSTTSSTMPPQGPNMPNGTTVIPSPTNSTNTSMILRT